MIDPAKQLRLWLDVYPDAAHIAVPRYELEAVLIRLAALESVSPGDCLECGRDEAAPTPGQYMAQYNRAEAAESLLRDVRDVVASALTFISPWKK
jgi:hypothetical protein